MQFAYVAFDEGGKLHRGQVEATDSREARLWVEGQYLGAISVRTVRTFNLRRLNVSIGGDKVPAIHVAFFFRQLASMLRVGVSINRALSMQSDSIRHRRLKQVTQSLALRVSQGSRVSDTLDLYPKVFPPVVVRLIRGAEAVGHLEEGFQDAGDYVMAGYLTTKKIMGAMYYPATAMTLLMAAGWFLVYKVFPVLAKMYVAFGVKLPAMTEDLIHFTDFAQRTGPYAGVVVVLLGTGFFLTLRTPNGKLMRDRVALWLPVFGQIVRLDALTRFLRTLRSTLMSELPLDDGLTLAASATSNQLFVREIGFVQPQIIGGQGIAGPLRDTKLFPPLVASHGNS